MTNKQFAVLMETLIRIEHKLDQDIHTSTAAAMGSNLQILPEAYPVGSPLASCPLCGVVPEYHVDPKEAFPYRTCHCKSGKAPGIALSDLAPMVAPKGVDHVGDEDLGDGAGGDAGGVLPDGPRR